MGAINPDFDPKKIENNWRDKWFKDNVYEAVDFSPKPKKYILAELPYPSGKFLHVGHAMRYTVPEIYSRFLRMQGYNVMFPIGWDCFGLPTETFAIKSGKTPEDIINEAKKVYKDSMQEMGYAVDWNRELTTSEPDYYQWTQWIFLKLYEKGLAEVKEIPAWWCKELGVLADEEVLPDPDGPTGKKSERGDYPVQKKVMKQWVLKITKYSEKLLKGLEEVNWPEHIITAQRNWIGKKEGINITYNVEKTEETITCFTTRPDTNFGATFVVLAPEHSFVSSLLSKKIKLPNNSNVAIKDIKDYVDKATSKTDLERQKEGKVKTGVFTGFYAVNTLNNKKMPIYVSDFVLSSYGTGAVVGVPGHDKRDFEFAQAFDLPIIRVVVSGDNDKSEITDIDQVQEHEGTMINSEFLDGLDIHDATKKIMDYMEEKGYGERVVTYKLRDQIWGRKRYWGEPIPLIYKQDGSVEKDYNLPLELPKITPEMAKKAEVNKEFPPLSSFEGWDDTTDKDGTKAKRETDTMPTWAGSNWYYIRYIDPKNKKEFANRKKMDYWLPVDKYFGGSEHTTVHLLYSRFWHKFLYDQKLVGCSEPYKERINGGLLLGPDGSKMSKRLGNVVNMHEAISNYGADAARTYLAFIGPYDETYPWNENGLVACYKLVRTIYKLKIKVKKQVKGLNEVTELSRSYNKMVKNMTNMMNELKMNTSVSEIMIFTNLLKKQKTIPGDVWEGFIKSIAPFAPFLAEELWQDFNSFSSWKKENSVHLQDWPTYNNKMLKEDTITLPIQINGKHRGNITVSSADVKNKSLVLKSSKKRVQKYLKDLEIKNEIYVPGKIVNFVV